MAFKLKSPFHAEVKTVGKQLGDGKAGVVGQGSNSSVVIGLKNTDIASVEGTQTVKPEPNNETVDNLVKKTEEGIPLGLNPKQEARFKTRKYKKGIRDDAKFDRQTEKAKNIYERNQFEELQNLDKEGNIIKEGKKGAGTTYYNPDAAEQEKDKRTKVSQDRLKKATLDAGAATTASNISSRRIDEKIKELNSPTNMEGNIKPNRAGTPVRMLKSMEDTTPMKYKSVRKAGRENLMSALAKKGGVEEVEMVNDFTTNLDSGTEIDLGPVPPAPKKKTIPKKADIKKKQSKGKGGKVTMDRKVSVKF